MALTNTTKFANREGMDLKFYKYENGGKGELAFEADYVAKCTLAVSKSLEWAYGGRGYSKQVAFSNPTEGTFTITTQISTMELWALATGEDPKESNRKKVTIKDDNSAKTNYYVVECLTLCKDTDGEGYTETVTLHKAAVAMDFSIDFTGEGAPQSRDITLELAADEEKLVVTLEVDDDTGTGTP